jgi:hypothetical protein
MKWFQRRIDFNALMQQHAQQLGRALVARLDRLLQPHW